MHRGEIWTLTETEAYFLVGADLLHQNGFPITYGLPVRADPPDGLAYPYVVTLAAEAGWLDIEAWAHTYAMRTLRIADLRTRLGIVGEQTVQSVDDALRSIWQL